MKLRSYAAVILGSAVLVSHLPAIAQMTPEMPAAEAAPPTESPAAKPETKAEKPVVEAPTAEMPEVAAPKPEMPEATPIAPVEAPATITPEVTQPEAAQPLPTDTMPLPTLKMAPSAPMVPPTTTAPTGQTPAVMTKVLPEESITGVPLVSMPNPSPIPAGDFTLPIALQVVQDVNVISSTPISDRYTSKENWNLAAWTSAVRNCMQQKPKLVRVVGEQQVPFMLNGEEGSVMLNATGKAVCPM